MLIAEEQQQCRNGPDPTDADPGRMVDKVTKKYAGETGDFANRLS